MKALLVAICAALALAACATLRTGSDFDASVDFSAYHSFSWLPHAGRGARNPLNAQRLQDAVRAELEARGYVYEADHARADFTVSGTIGSEERTDVSSFPVEYRGPWRWGGPYFGREIDVRQYREGTLSVDVFDVRSHRPVWHGWAKKDLSRADLDSPGPAIRAAVAAVIASFPPGPRAAPH
jgi:hypothetical protein